jgi:hypothetical protein
MKMHQRALLKSQIIKAWHQCIINDYRTQRINSERSLQASFWSRLNSILSKNRRMFIEPGFVINTNKESRRVYPDLLICHTKEVIAVIELKYQPRVKPNYKKDVATLSNIARYRKSISISNQRFRGKPIDERIYSLSKHILFVWAGIHRDIGLFANDNEPLYSKGYHVLKNCFIELHAETSKTSSPNIYWRD